MNYLLSLQVSEFQEKFNDVTGQVVQLQMSAIGLDANVSSLQPWQLKGLTQFDEQKTLMAQVKKLKSTVNNINKAITDQVVTDVDESESLLIDNLNKQGKQINSTLEKISQTLANTKLSLIAKSPWASIADFFDDLGSVLEEIFIQSIKYAKKAINLLPDQQRQDVKRLFGWFQKFLPQGED
jgi:hypothetical protein